MSCYGKMDTQGVPNISVSSLQGRDQPCEQR